MLKERLRNVPLKPGVYIYKDSEGRVIYVGKAKALRNRMRSYFQSPEKMHPKVRALMARVADFDYIVTTTEVEALILENNLIKSYKPRYNIDLRDDKTYPYLKVTTGEDYPRLVLVREGKDGVSRYFGPYTDVTSLRETIKLLNLVFPLRTCKTLRMGKRPCLNRDIGRCLAPCSGEIKKDEYRQVVDGLLDFMEGNSRELLQQKEEEMKEAAARLEFEKAAHLRDQIESIKKVGEKQKITFENPYNLDVIALSGREREHLVLLFKIRAGTIVAQDTFWLNRAIDEDEAQLMEFFLKYYYADCSDIPAEILLSHLPEGLEVLQSWLQAENGRKVRLRVPQRGDKKSLLDMVVNNAALLWQEKHEKEQKNQAILKQLSQVLNLEVIPQRIECYDISHLGGEETVASMVVFTRGIADRKAYRRFKMKIDQNDDFASLSEALQRRFKRAREGDSSFLPEPDLILIDGGAGQVNAVYRVLQEMQVDIPLFSLAKKNEEIYAPGPAAPLRLSRRDEALQLLQRLRDEAHRFAIEYNRQRRAGKVRASSLDEIEGIGPARKKKLLSHFGSVKAIQQASLEELLQLPGMTRTTAENVYRHYHKR
ncbi:MAG: excinuclease ABC subunit UvrC [Syntrophomonadaceae bacterium]|nr:excinuclease ABC subunit UvrC [Syntrophomonadaceae bacterium]MDD3270761.1 excinuclease ABC subunit UvrC [Syntrophomonadaceae bacterium]MDD4562688.1 excinuclease ABC subunit UvrC [Syntrophomonadaceae bacterium]